MTASDIRDIFTARYLYRFREVGLFEFGINDKVFDAFVIMPDRQYFKGFEFKVSRADFLSDMKKRERIVFSLAAGYSKISRAKWRGYLQYCHMFYFVCPEGLIRPEEVEAPAGLIWVAAPHRFQIMKRPKRIAVTMDPALAQRILFFFAARAKTRSGRFF